MKISVITAVFNRVGTIAHAMESVSAQTFSNAEYIVIDGASTDGTLDIIRSQQTDKMKVFSEKDAGIYDALNKGISRSTGDVIGFMHSDDFFADEQVLARVAAAFSDKNVDAVYGDLDYVAHNDVKRVIRRWRSGIYHQSKLAWGWMPPHPTLYLRRRVFERWGVFDTQYRIAADYDAILRYFSQGKIHAVYVPHVFVKMRLGGESNQSLSKIWLKMREDYRALCRNQVGGFISLVCKNFRKINQFF
jgi:glycosyltransferase involved in cell wall biosynthesis